MSDSRFYAMLDQRIIIAIATDGATKTKKGSIGFVIAIRHTMVIGASNLTDKQQ